MVSLYDTFSRTVKPVTPLDGKVIGLYFCGPTVYKPSHIGHFRTFIIHDILRRTLEAEGWKTRHLRNITDVDDKTIRNSQQTGIPLREFTSRLAKAFQNDCLALNMLEPHVEPRATDHIEEQVQLIQQLMSSGHAYKAEDGSVYFSVRSFEDYGKLTHLDPETLRSQSETSGGTINLADEYDRDSIADFALWKSRKPEDGENYWPSPWGEGRPGWHVECSAMSMKYLGQTIDLHGGGIDLCFPHHENEIAQSEAATGVPFARHWFHSRHLLIDGQKMSKSLDNFYTLKDIRERGFTAMELRYALISGNYHQHLNFTFGSLKSARSALQKLEKETDKILEKWGLPSAILDFEPNRSSLESPALMSDAWDSLRHDLNTPASLGHLFKGLKHILQSEDGEQVKSSMTGLGRLLFALGLKLESKPEKAAPVPIPEAVLAQAEERWKAKKNRDWAKADSIRGKLEKSGWKILDRHDGFDIERFDS